MRFSLVNFQIRWDQHLLNSPAKDTFACKGHQPIKHDPSKFQGKEHFGHRSWQALDFNKRKPFKYRYHFLSQGTEDSAMFTARAEGDLDCDTTSSIFEQAGYADHGKVRVQHIWRMNEFE